MSTEYYVALLRNRPGEYLGRVDKSFGSLVEATTFLEKIKPRCEYCKFRVDCLTSEYCLRLRFVELRSNGTTANLLPKLERA